MNTHKDKGEVKKKKKIMEVEWIDSLPDDIKAQVIGKMCFLQEKYSR